MTHTVEDAVALAAREGLRVAFRRLGTWGSAQLLAEYEPRERTIAIDLTACERLRARKGAEFAARFVACAILHETFHHRFPRAGELAAHAFVRTQTGEDPHAFEEALRPLTRGLRT